MLSAQAPDRAPDFRPQLPVIDRLPGLEGGNVAEIATGLDLLEQPLITSRFRSLRLLMSSGCRLEVSAWSMWRRCSSAIVSFSIDYGPVKD